jgi:trk system potassium uptake protein TrkA
MRVAVAGAGDTGQAIARALLQDGHQVLLIERYRDAYRPSRVPDADWMFADACELARLQAAGIETCDAVIAATGDDKVNVVFAFLCKTEFAVPRVVGRINNPANRHLFSTEWGVDVALATRDSLVAAADQEVAPRRAVPLLTLHSHTELIELTVAVGSAADGRAVGDLPVPDDALVLAVVRDKRLVPVTSVLGLRAGDELLILASPTAEPRLRVLVDAAAGPGAQP